MFDVVDSPRADVRYRCLSFIHQPGCERLKTVALSGTTLAFLASGILIFIHLPRDLFVKKRKIYSLAVYRFSADFFNIFKKISIPLRREIHHTRGLDVVFIIFRGFYVFSYSLEYTVIKCSLTPRTLITESVACTRALRTRAIIRHVKLQSDYGIRRHKLSD